jgi:hypothetical protein
MRPPQHDAEGLLRAAKVVPRDKLGRVDASNGKVVLLSIGLSNTNMEFDAFVQALAQDPEVHPQMVLVNGAQGGQSADKMNTMSSPYWQHVDLVLSRSNVAPEQVQVVWLKQAHSAPTQAFPPHAQALQKDLKAIVQILQQRFVNLQQCFLSSRIYAGYATGKLSPEPFAYESGFSVKWLIEEQISGDAALNFNSGNGPVNAPWISWGPYNWADGVAGRSDGLQWLRQDFLADGTHPSTLGEAKVARALSDFFKTDATTKPWFLASPGFSPAQQASVRPYGKPVAATPQLAVSRLPIMPSNGSLTAFGFAAPPNSLGWLLLGSSPLPEGQVPLAGGSLLVAPEALLPVSSDPLGRALHDFGAIPVNLQLSQQSFYLQLVLVDRQAPSGVALSRGLALQVGH